MAGYDDDERLQQYHNAYPRLRLLNSSTGDVVEGDNSKCKYFIPEIHDIDFPKWMDEWKPSTLQSNTDFRYIVVLSPKNFHVDLEAADTEGLKDGVEDLKKSGRKIDEEVIRQMATDYNILGGKWMMYPRTWLLSDLVWSIIAPAVVGGQLTDSCVAAKISAPSPNRRSTLCVYLKDFTDKDSIMEMERAIRALKIKCELRFKPDIYSEIGINGANWIDYQVTDRIIESRVETSSEDGHRSIFSPPQQ